MSDRLKGKKVLLITSNTGVERDELLKPLKALAADGGSITHASIEGGDVQTVLHDTEKDAVVKSTAKLSDVSARDFDVLVVPGGTVNADKLRVDKDAQHLVQDFVGASKPIAAICHGPWILVDAGVIEGKTLTSYQSVKTDLLNAGAEEWVDQQVKRCGANGWTLITSRNPRDLDAFSSAIAEELVAA
ncbi:type 1 glutamine amidotransferase domain-containing protein [Robbsia sp. KACC 23696]|uniref:type 1 glutamine amidotransferase domain-containing protein n=1 Tax=Robbsia sp. KACC 23696 TaxID=3149231 RepID=UPI00325AEA7D